MAYPEPLGEFLGPLERSGLPYCVTGSVAAGIYGEPRTTRDIDLVLLLRVEEIAKLRAAFPEENYYVPPTEVLAMELLRGARGCLNLYHHASGFKADLFFVVRDPLHLWAMENRRRITGDDGDPFWLAPPEYVILRKLEYFREGDQDKHVRDIRSMLAVTEVDRAFIEQYIENLGLREQWMVCEPRPSGSASDRPEGT